jgi:hypothetical protein
MSGSKFFLWFMVLAIGIITVWGIQFYNFYAFKTILLDKHLEKIFDRYAIVDDEQTKIAETKIVNHFNTEGYTIGPEDVEFFAIVPGSLSLSYEVYQLSSHEVVKTEFTVKIQVVRKVLFFDKVETIVYNKTLKR